MRLVGGATNTSGPVEVCIEKAFQSVCDRDWTHKDAQVVCKQLGLNTEGEPCSLHERHIITHDLVLQALCLSLVHSLVKVNNE